MRKQRIRTNRRKSCSLRAFGLALCSILVFQICPVSANTGDDSNIKDQKARHADQWGLEVQGIRRTAADYMLDFRFKILDTKKAARLMDRGTKAYLVDEKTGRKFQIPVTTKLGPLRQSGLQTKPDKTYFMFFANPARTLKQGDLVSVVIGDFKAEHIKIE